jgi:hypothetical protein
MKSAKSSKPNRAPKAPPRRGPVPLPAANPTPAPDGRRPRRPRPTPSWLLEQRDLDDVARRRCLLMLSVLSGETPVTDAIEGTDLSRQAYYCLEERALRAMLRALTPGIEPSPPGGPDPATLKRVTDLESKVKHLEREKRRLERLLLLTRKALRPGPLKTGHRVRRPKMGPPSTNGGPAPLPSSDSMMSQETAPPASTPTPDGAAGR